MKNGRLILVILFLSAMPVVIFYFKSGQKSVSKAIRRPLNMAQIKGSDSNGNGVRDDLEDFIDKNYSQTPVMRLAALQDAKAFQRVIENPDEFEMGGELQDKAMSCEIALFGDEKMTEIRRAIEAQTVNNSEREEAYLRYNLSFSGKLLPGIKASSKDCDFKVGK